MTAAPRFKFDHSAAQRDCALLSLPDAWQARIQAQPNGCWAWTGAGAKGGHGAIAQLVNGKWRPVAAHRVVFERLGGVIPPNLRLSHDCEALDEKCTTGHPCPHRRCVNPWHMATLTVAAIARRTGVRRDGSNPPTRDRCAWTPADLPPRLSKHIKVADSGCWHWIGHRNPQGYGVATHRESDTKSFQTTAHRVVYTWLVDAIPQGLCLDHMCRVRHCVNPAHLEAVTLGENTLRSPIATSAVNARKTCCVQGHPFVESNTYRPPGTAHRQCRACNHNRDIARRKRRTQARVQAQFGGTG